jgi:transposase
MQRNREFSNAYQGKFFKEQGIGTLIVSVHCSHACFAPVERDLFSLAFLQSEEEQMADAGWPRERYGEIFWRAHHEAWRQSDLNQREYCEAHGLSLKAFGNWRAKFKAEPQLPPRKLLYRRGGLSQRLSHTLGHSLSHMTNGSPEPAFIIPPARDGHRRSFSEADKRRIVDAAGQPGASLSDVARRYGIAARVLFRWKQEFKPSAAPMFVTVQIADASAPSDAAPSDEEHAS